MFALVRFFTAVEKCRGQLQEEGLVVLVVSSVEEGRARWAERQ